MQSYGKRRSLCGNSVVEGRCDPTEHVAFAVVSNNVDNNLQRCEAVTIEVKLCCKKQAESPVACWFWAVPGFWIK